MCINGKGEEKFAASKEDGWRNTGKQENRFYSRSSHCTANILVKNRKIIVFVGKYDTLTMQRWSWEENSTCCLLGIQVSIHVPRYSTHQKKPGQWEQQWHTTAGWENRVSATFCGMIISSYCWHHHLSALSKSSSLKCMPVWSVILRLTMLVHFAFFFPILCRVSLLPQ